LLISSRRTGGPAIKDRLAALDACTWCRGRGCACRHDWRLVYRPWSCLWHYHAPRRNHWPCRYGRRLRRLRCGCLRFSRVCARCSLRFLGLCCDLGRLRNWCFNNWRRWRGHWQCGFGLFAYRRRNRSGYRRHGLGRDRLLRRRSSRLGRLGRRCAHCRGHRRLYNHGGRNNCNDWARGRCPCRRLCHNGSSRRLRRNRGRCGRNNRWSRARLRHNLSRFRPYGSCRRRCDRHHRRCGLRWGLRRGDRSLARRHMAPASLGFLLLFLCQNGLHHVPWLGNVRQINFRGNRLRRAR
jgi:hypothetical protein